MTKVFVTGGAGFIGSHLVGRLLGERCEVTVYDDLSYGDKARLESYLDSPLLCFVHGDILDIDLLRKSMERHDVVWHLASNADIRKGTRDTELDIRQGVVGTRNVLEAMRVNDIDRMGFTSSSTVYGDLARHIVSEESAVLPISLYGAGKVAAEGLISAYCHLFGLRALVFRLGNIVGSGMKRGVIYDTVEKLKENPRKISVLGNGTQARTYLDVGDCLDAFWSAMSWGGGLYNVGNLSIVTVKQLVGYIIREMNLDGVEVEYGESDRGWAGDAPMVYLDVGKIQGIGWQPRHTSEEAIIKTARSLI